MTVSLKIENDTELRAYIKDLVKGQILSITREEITDIIIEELSGKIKNLDDNRLRLHLREAFKDYVEKLASQAGVGSYYYNKEAFVEEVKLIVTARTPSDKELQALFEKAMYSVAKEKLKDLVK